MLGGVELLCRDKHLHGMPHIVAIINSFALPFPFQQCTITQMCKYNVPQLLQRVIAREEREPDDGVKKHPYFQQWQFNEGMQYAFAAGSLEIVKFLAENFPARHISHDVMCTAAAQGRFEIVRWLFENHHDAAFYYRRWNRHRFVIAALEGGHLDVAKWFWAQGNCSLWGCITAAVKSGDIEAVKWAHTLYFDDTGDSGAVDAAISGGHMEILKWLVGHFDSSVNLADLVSRGHDDEVKWLIAIHRQKCVEFKQVISEAAGLGNVDIAHLLLLHARTDGVGCCADAMDIAACNGHLHMIQWLHNHSRENCTSNAIDYAAENGHLEVTKWLSSSRTEGCTTRAMDQAAVNGHLDVVQWLHHNRTEGCTVAAMDQAAANGHFEMLEWLHNNRQEGCTTDAVDRAAQNGHFHIVNWLIDNRSEGGSAKAINYATAGGHLEIVQCLSEKTRQDCSSAVLDVTLFIPPFRTTMDVAADNGHSHLVKWFHLNRTEGCTTWAMNSAAENGHLEVVQWLHANRDEGCTTKAMDNAIRKGHFSIVKWLHENRREGCTGFFLFGALYCGHFDIVLFIVSAYPQFDLMHPLSCLEPEKLLRFLDWLYSHRSPEFVASFLEKYKSREEWSRMFQCEWTLGS